MVVNNDEGLEIYQRFDFCSKMEPFLRDSEWNVPFIALENITKLTFYNIYCAHLKKNKTLN